MLNNTNNVISCISRLAIYSSNTPLGRNMSYLRFKYDVNFTDGLHVNLIRLNNVEFPDLTRQGLINVVTDMYFARNCTDKFPGFTDEMIETILYDVCVN